MYFCQCPKCGGVNVNEDITQTILKINHKKDCVYVRMGIKVTFNAEEITKLNKSRIYEICKEAGYLEKLKDFEPTRQI